MSHQLFRVTDHTGKTHEVKAKDETHAKLQVVDAKSTYVPGGIPMSKWSKVKVEKFGNMGYLKESFMSTYRRNESQNRHAQNLVHLAKHYGSDDDKKEAQFYVDELKKHGHNKHHQSSYALHQKLWPKAVEANKLEEKTLTPAETAKKEEIVKSMKKGKAGFIERYGKRAKEVMYATATKKAKELAEGKDHHVIASTFTTKERQTFTHIPKDSKWEKHMKEEIEVLDELKKSTLKSYISKASKDIHKQATIRQSSYTHGEKTKSPTAKTYYDKTVKSSGRKGVNREIGIDRALGKLEEEITLKVVKDVLNEVFTRKHFRQVADIIKNHPDPQKRKELASHHSEIFAKSNPRFDKKRFYDAAGVSEEVEQIDEGHHVIASTVEKDDETGKPLYWHNQDGWVDKKSATKFSTKERQTFRYIPKNSKWEHHS